MNTRRLAVSVAALALLLLLAGTTLDRNPTVAGMGVSQGIAAQTYTDHDAIWIDGNADFLAHASAESWTGDGSQGNPIIIEGYRIFDSSTQCIRLWNVDLHWVVQDCLLEGGPPYVCGLWLSNASNGLFTNNVVRNRHSAILGFSGTTNVSIDSNQIYQNTASVLEVQGGMSGCKIIGNTIYNNGGNNLWITGGFEDGLIAGNTITGGGYGVYAAGAIDSEITANTISDTSTHGMMFMSSVGLEITDNTISYSNGGGMLISGSNCIVVSNTIANITGPGIDVASGHFCNISFNEVANCSEYGMELSSTVTNATVWRNVFTANGDDCQVIDEGDDNDFMYNHFSERTSPDENSDNVVDVPYAINGDTGNEDPCPLVDPDGQIPSPTTTITTSTTTNTGQGLPVEMVVIAGAGLLIVVVVAVFVKRGR